MPKELDIHFANVDERTSEDLLLFTRELSKYVNYYRNDISVPAGNWSTFFPYDDTTVKQLLASTSGSLPPHLALFLTFLELYKKPQEIINRITGRHLDFYYQQVLQMKKKAAVADKAHVLLELKKNVAPVSILPEHLFSAGKDNTGIELIYAPTRETIINASRVDSLRSLFLDNGGRGIVRYAPVANSEDGKGDKLKGDEPKWHGFGHKDLPQAEVGFAIASPVLRMKEGVREVTVTLKLNSVTQANLNTSSLAGAFAVFVTGEKGWLGPYSISPTLNGNELKFTFTVPQNEKAVIDYNATIHGYYYITQAPVIQVLLETNKANISYKDLINITLQGVKITVTVSNITSLNLESDGGALDPKKAFLPFGPQSTVGSRFRIGYSEAFSKKLSKLTIELKWKDASSDFKTYYQDYDVRDKNNNKITIDLSFRSFFQPT